MKRFIIEQSDEEFYTSHSGLALVGLAVNRFTSLSSALAAMYAPAGLIAGIDIIRSYCALLAQGKSDFVAVEQYRNDDFFREALGNKAVPSEGTMRQRIDEYVDKILASVSWASIEWLSLSTHLSWPGRMDGEPASSARFPASPERIHQFHTGNTWSSPSVLQTETVASCRLSP